MVPRSLISPLSIVLVVVGLLLAVVGVIYLVVNAGHLPGFLPGHLSVPTHALRNGRVIRTHADTKKGLAVLVAAAITFIAAWYLKFRYDPVD
jgi:hypothetical protein